MSLEGAIVGDTMLDIATNEVNIQNEFAESTAGKVMFMLPSIFMGASAGGQAQKTMEPMTDFFKQRSEAKAAFKNSPQLQKQHGGSDNKAFRNFFKTARLKASASASGFEQGDEMDLDDMKGDSAINSVVSSVEQMEGFTNGSSKVAVANNNPGNLQWFKGIEEKYPGASKGESYLDGDDKERFHVKFDNVAQGRSALKDVVKRKWSESNQDINVFTKNYTGLGSGEELSNYSDQIKRDLTSNKPTTNVGQRTSKNLVDKNKIRAFYLNAMTDNVFDPASGKTVQQNHGFNVTEYKPRDNSTSTSTGSAAVVESSLGRDNVLSDYNQGIGLFDVDAADKAAFSSGTSSTSGSYQGTPNDKGGVNYSWEDNKGMIKDRLRKGYTTALEAAISFKQDYDAGQDQRTADANANPMPIANASYWGRKNR